MYTKILVPLDGSPLSEGILPYARTFAKAFEARVELLHVIEPEVISTFADPAHGRYADAVEADIRRHGLAYLKPLAASLPEPSVVQCSAQVGEPADVIVDRGSAEAGTLIAMATRGRSGLQRWVLGSVADKVLRTATNHLLLAHPAEPAKGSTAAPLKTVVVPLDGSSLAEKALPLVVTLAKKMNLELILIRVHALPSPALYASDEYVPNWVELTDQIRQEAKEYLEKKVERLQREGLSRVSYVLIEGNGAAEIIDFARKTPEGLVAMCTHGRSGIRRILGSVSDRVVRHSGDPVLVIPPTS